jgi:hypothetical protein
LIANAALYAGFWFMLRTRHERPVWQWRAVKVGAALWLVLAAAMSAFGLAWMADR